VTAGGAPVAYRERLAVAEAVAAVLAEGAPPGAGPGAALGSEVVPLADAVGRVLARDVAAPADVPPWPNASMDGYAVRAADVRGAGAGRPVALRVAATAYAAAQGSDRGATGPVGPGAAVRIATGAAVPPGTEGRGPRRGHPPRPRRPGACPRRRDRDARDDAPGGGAARRNVRPAGEDVAAGAVAAAAGTGSPPESSAFSPPWVPPRWEVARRPRVALIATGDELVPLERAAEAHAGRGIVSSNTAALAALVREAGGDPVDLGIAPIPGRRPRPLPPRPHARLRPGALYRRRERGRARPRAPGRRRRRGQRCHFWRVRCARRPLAFGPPGARAAGGGALARPPGNPVSTVVTFALFSRPLLARPRRRRRPSPPRSPRPRRAGAHGAPLTTCSAPHSSRRRRPAARRLTARRARGCSRASRAPTRT
jgi:molybdopterin molybdotransferase